MYVSQFQSIEKNRKIIDYFIITFNIYVQFEHICLLVKNYLIFSFILIFM